MRSAPALSLLSEMTVQWVFFVRSGALGDFVLSLPLLLELGAGGRPVCVVSRSSYREILPPGTRCDAFIDVDSADAMWLFTGEPVPDRYRGMAAGADVYQFGDAVPDVAAGLAASGVARIRFLPSRPSAPPHVTAQIFAGAEVAWREEVLRRPLWPRTGCGACLWVHPGSGSRRKNLAPEALATLAAAWVARHGLAQCVSFGEADGALIEETLAAFGARGLAPVPVICPTLGELRRRLSAEARFYLGNDSGVSHLAGVCGVPGVALFRTTSPAIWQPLGSVRWAWGRSAAELAAVERAIVAGELA